MPVFKSLCEGFQITNETQTSMMLGVEAGKYKYLHNL